MATPREVALDHYSDRQSFVDATAEAAAAMWRDVDPKAISRTWAAQIPEMAAVVAGAQMGAARLSDDYLDDILEAEDVDPFSVADVDPAGFRGASDGRGLLTLLANPAIVTLLAIKDGLDIARALTAGAANLDMLVRTQVADAGRAADQVALTARPAAKGYVRMAVGKTCARCLLLSGKFYLWNAGFARHPRCDCIHTPCGDPRAARIPGPRALYDNLSAAERSRAGFSLADQRALAEGADFGQVVNAKRGMYLAGGRKFTREGTTKRGFASTRLEGRPRKTPDEIFREAGPDRDEALRLLHENGYLLEAPVPAPRLAAAEPSPAAAGGGTAAGAAAASPTIRPALEAARTTGTVDRAFADEFERITGRRIFVQFNGSAATAREHAEGLLRGAELFPEVRLERVTSTPISAGSTEYAHASGGRISFNYHWGAAASRKRYLDTLAEDSRTGWHPVGTASPVAVAVHEFGHVLDIATLGEGAEAEVRLLLTRRARQRDARLAAERAAGQMIDADDFVAGTGVDGLISREVSRYAMKNTRELVAEAFSDVVMNGPAASQLSREIFDLIEAEYRRGGRRLGTSTVVSASEPAPANLSKLTIPQLKAIAKDRQIRIPPRARKAEILALLEPPPAAGAVTKAQVRADARAAARERNRQIEARGPVEDMLAEVDELLGKGATTDVMLEHLDALGGAVPAADLASLRKAVQTGDRTKIRAAITRLGNKQGLKATAPAGKTVKFDPEQHELFGGGDLAAGTPVVVVRRGTTLTIDGETITFNRAKVSIVAPPKPKLPNESARRLDEVIDELSQKLKAMMSWGGNSRAYAEARKAALKEIRAALAVKHGGLKAMVDAIEISATGDSLRIRGRIMAGRASAGTFDRFFARDADGKLVAHHSLLMIDSRYQGSGFAREFNQNLYDWYRRSGFDRVMTHADIDVGGYTWATQGFDFRDRAAFDAWAQQAKARITRMRTGQFGSPTPGGFAMKGTTPEETQAQLDRFELLLDEAESGRRQVSAYEFSQLGRLPGQGKDDQWVGKVMMLGTDWFGAKPL